MTITIPEWVISALFWYFVVGQWLWWPLQVWANRFVSPKRSTGAWMRGQSLWFLVRSLWWCGLIWPGLIRVLVKDEWRYGLGKRYRLWRCERQNLLGCCSACDGTGSSRDVETNGRCWDCYGTGHTHR